MNINKKIFYKILDNSGLAFNNMTGIKVGMELEYLGHNPITNQIMLEQPSGNGTVSLYQWTMKVY